MKTITILIVEDEIAIRDMIQFALAATDFEIIEAGSVPEAMSKTSHQLPDLILLDWMLPGMNGIDFAKQLKRDDITRDIPIIMLSARAEEENKIKGLETGADDYIIKPFSPRELIARIKTVLRRGPLINVEGIIQFSYLSLNTNTHQLMKDDEIIFLTPIEYKLLYFFVTHQERIYSRNQLLDQVWGTNHYIDERTVDVQVRRLRSRLKPFQCDHCIKTIRGSGYQFSVSGSIS